MRWSGRHFSTSAEIAGRIPYDRAQAIEECSGWEVVNELALTTKDVIHAKERAEFVAGLNQRVCYEAAIESSDHFNLLTNRSYDCNCKRLIDEH
jgi:hypothetical protein